MKIFPTQCHTNDTFAPFLMPLDTEFLTQNIHLMTYERRNESTTGPLKLLHIIPTDAAHSALAVIFKKPENASVKPLTFVFRAESGKFGDQTIGIKTNRKYFPFAERRGYVFHFRKDNDEAKFAVPGPVEEIHMKTLKFGSEEALVKFSQRLRKVELFYRWMTMPRQSNQAAIFRDFRRIGVHIEKGIYHFIVLHCGASRKESHFSWRQASSICGKINAHLPKFFSRQEHNDLIFLLKTSTYTFISLAAFIDLVLAGPSMKLVSLASVHLTKTLVSSNQNSQPKVYTLQQQTTNTSRTC